MNKKFLAIGGMLLCCASLLIAYFYFQLYLGLPPCPLCILDRWIIAGLAFGFLLLWFDFALLKTGAHICFFLLLPAGLAVGGRHVWLENFPNSASGCLPPQGGKDLWDLLTSAFVGTADCSIVLWSFAGLSIAGWTLALYLVLIALWLPMLLRPRQK